MRKREIVPKNDENGESGYSTALTRGLQLLRTFGPSDASLGNYELMERTGLPKATVSRLTLTLAGLGYLSYNEVDGRYSLGNGVIALGYSALSANPIVHIARPLMQKLADDTGAAVALGGRDQGEMIYIANCRSESLVTLRLNIGSRVPLWRTGMGLAYLVGLGSEERVELKKRFLFAEEERLAVEPLLENALSEYAEHGYVTAFGTWHNYVRAVGVPLRPRDGSPPLAITCGGISEIIDEKSVAKRVGPALVALAKRIEAVLSGVVDSD